jgi:raffinose/stachyose/melibiose transport system substrate-binding protein
MRAIRIRQALGSPRVRFAGIAVLAAVFALGAGASDARPTRSDQVTLTMLANVNKQPAYDVLIPNFERVYPNITIDISYAPVPSQLEPVELAAGTAPDLLVTQPGSGSTISVPTLAEAGDLAPLIRKPWVNWSLPSMISADKYGAGLFAFTPAMSPFGVFTNDDLLKKLGLQVPQTFPELLDLCRKAAAARTVAVLFPGGSAATVLYLIDDLAIGTVYGEDKHWVSEQRAGAVRFESSEGWHRALQMLVDMESAGCFEPGAAATTTAAMIGQFAQGQALMALGLSGNKGLIDAADPQFSYSFHAFPNSADVGQTLTEVSPGDSVSVNAHSSAQNQVAAQLFIDFIARPKQDALYAQTTGFVTQYELLHRQFAGFMAADAPLLGAGRYLLSPHYFWWNPSVGLADEQDAIGLLTGQETIDDVLNAMDAAWRQGPS